MAKRRHCWPASILSISTRSGAASGAGAGEPFDFPRGVRGGRRASRITEKEAAPLVAPADRAAVFPPADRARLGPLQVAAERPLPEPGLPPKTRFLAAGNRLGRAGNQLLLVERGSRSLRFSPRHHREARPRRVAKQTRHRLERVRRGGFRQSLEPPPADDCDRGIDGGQNDLPLPLAGELVVARPIYVLVRARGGTATDWLPGAR